MKQLRVTTTKPMPLLGILNPEKDHEVLIKPDEIGELIMDKIKGKSAYIHGLAQNIAGYDVPTFIDGNLGQLELPIDQQDILLLLPSGEYKCKAEYLKENNYYLITLITEPSIVTK